MADLLEEKLEKIRNLWKMIDESITKEDFVKAFENVIKFVVAVKQSNEAEIKQMRSLSEQLKTDNDADLNLLKQQANELVKREVSKIREAFQSLTEVVDEKISQIKDGKDADETKIVEDVLNKIPDPEPVILDDGEKIVEKINELPTDDDDLKIDASHIKNLPKEKSNPSGGSGKVSGGRNISVDVNIVTLNIPIQPTAPADPVSGMLWIDNS